MNRFVKLFVASLYPEGDGGTGGAGSGGTGAGAGGSGETDEERDKRLLAERKLSDEIAKVRVRAKTAEETAKTATEEARTARKELEDYKRTHPPDATGGEGGGEGSKVPKEVELRIKGLEEKLALADKIAAEKEKASAQEKRLIQRDALISDRMGAASVLKGAQESVRALIEKNTRIEEDGSIIYKGKNRSGEAIEVPLADLDVSEIAHEGDLPAKSGGGSGGRAPVSAGSGKSGDVLREYSQAEWDKLTPEQRKAIQRERTAATGARVR